jgi:glucose/arabinose dehydrogenase
MRITVSTASFTSFDSHSDDPGEWDCACGNDKPHVRYYPFRFVRGKLIKRILFSLALALLIGLLSYLLDARPAMAVNVPSGFQHSVVTSTPNPIALAFTPPADPAGRRLLIATKTGQVRVYKGGQLLQSPALDIGNKICWNSEQGLLGVAVDPDFGTGTNRYIYLYYTAKVGPTCGENGDEVNRVSRFVLSDSNIINPASETKLIDNIPSFGIHNAGDLHFGKDKYLYISVGDAGCDIHNLSKCQSQNNNSRDRNTLLGKILRIKRDGGIPESNPYTGPGSARCNLTGRTSATNCQETFAMGLRNPFRMGFDPDAAGTRFWINDVGANVWEEIDAGRAGADYGWNVREGYCATLSRTDCGPPPSGMTNPIHAYDHNTGCESVTGAAFVPNGSFTSSYDNAYLFGDYVCNKIFKLTPKPEGGFARSLFASDLGPGGPIAMTFGPYGNGKALYYTTFNDGGQVRRIAFTGGNRAPVAVAEGDPNVWSEDLTINLTGAKSRDPDGDSLTYQWDFTSDGTVDATGARATHTYPSYGRYTVTLRVRDHRGALSEPDIIRVFPGDTPPDPVIGSPKAGTLFRVGQRLTLSGSAADAEDDNDGRPGTTPALRWEVLRHHDGNHTHPWFSGTGNDLTFTAPAPEGLLSTDPTKNYLEIRLTATDSLGLSSRRILRLRPKIVDVRFETRPSELKLEVNGIVFRSPRTFHSWQGYKLNVYAPRQQYNGRRWRFRSWSDGLGARHTITTPSTPTTYVATFKRVRR